MLPSPPSPPLSPLPHCFTPFDRCRVNDPPGGLDAFLSPTFPPYTAPHLLMAAGSMTPRVGSMRPHSKEKRKVVLPIACASSISSRYLRAWGGQRWGG